MGTESKQKYEPIFQEGSKQFFADKPPGFELREIDVHDEKFQSWYLKPGEFVDALGITSSAKMYETGIIDFTDIVGGAEITALLIKFTKGDEVTYVEHTLDQPAIFVMSESARQLLLQTTVEVSDSCRIKLFGELQPEVASLELNSDIETTQTDENPQPELLGYRVVIERTQG